MLLFVPPSLPPSRLQSQRGAGRNDRVTTHKPLSLSAGMRRLKGFVSRSTPWATAATARAKAANTMGFIFS